MRATMMRGVGGWAVCCGLGLAACTAEIGFGRPGVGDGGDGRDGSAGANSVDGSDAPGSGDDGEGGGTPQLTAEELPQLGPTSFSCDESLRFKDPPLRRLTRIQYSNTLEDVLARALDDGAAARDIMSSLAASLNEVTDDVRPDLQGGVHHSFRRLDHTVQQSHVDHWYSISRQVGELLSQGSNLDALLGDCSNSSGGAADACIDSFIERFGRLAFRRPLDQEEVEFYRGFYEPSVGIDPPGIVDLVTGLLNAPFFLYLVESGEDEGDVEDTFELSAYELASRLSYHFWNSMPDEELLDLAESGDLLREEVYEEQVERLWANERTYDTTSEFFREWLRLEDMPQLDMNRTAPSFQAFAGEQMPSGELRQAMIDEAVDLLNYYTWDSPGSATDFITTPYSFAKSEELAELYGVEAWDGTGTPPELPGNRIGLLTRAAFLSTGTTNTRPIMKGVFIRKQLLCDQIPPPPPGANVVDTELDPDLTTREVVEGITEVPGTACALCHQQFINPLGFPTEEFDALGRPRTEQDIFGEDGALIATKPILANSVPQVLMGDDTPVSSSAELMTLVAESGKVEACFARGYFRFTFGRQEGVVSDGCVLEELRQALVDGGSVADMLRTVALSPTFRTRAFVPSSN